MILVDQGETPLFEIERELVDQRGFPPSVPVLADVENAPKMRQVFERYTPGVVFHAAAYKHVPLMEANPLESVRNNSLATRTIAQVAIEFGAKRFVLVSTDKAVNPKTVMGQSKALCEWIVETYGHRLDIETRFVAVRFGNVLGSSGSVIPIFRRQIERGGPVTVTHPEMTRFFMTIPEAVSLIVQAGAIGGRGEIFVLDMGEPVRIVDLAREHDPAVGQGSREATSRSSTSALGPARSSTRSLVGGRARRADRPSEDPRSSRGRRSTRRGSTTSSRSSREWSSAARRSISSRGSGR